MKKLILFVAFWSLCTINYTQAQTNTTTNTQASSATTAQTDTKENPVNIYNPNADAAKDLKAAVKKAKAENKHVFVQVGGNWCVWCIKFHNLVESTPELKKYLNDNYVALKINYSPENKNADLLKKLSNPGRFGYPVFLIIDGKGKLIHTQNSEYLEEGDGHSVKKIMNFLKNWNYGALKAEVK